MEKKMEKEYTFRRYLKKDFNFVVTHYIEVFSAAPWNELLAVSQIEQYLQNIEKMNTFIGFVLESTKTNELLGCALGFVRPWYQGKEYHMDTFFIINEHQNKGVGTFFLDSIKNELKEKEISTIVLDTDRQTPSEKFYLNNQFYSLDTSITLYSSTE